MFLTARDVSENAAVETPVVPSESQDTESQYVDLKSITDPEQLSELLNDPRSKLDPEQVDQLLAEGGVEAFLAANAATQAATVGDEDKEKEPTDDDAGEEKVAAEGEAEGEEGEEKGEEEHRTKRRERIVVAHLGDPEKQVLRLVSMGEKLGPAQRQVVQNLIKAGQSQAEAEEAVYGEARVTGEQPKPARPALTPSQIRIGRAQQALDAAEKLLDAEIEAHEKDYDPKHLRVISNLNRKIGAIERERDRAHEAYDYEQFEAKEKVASTHKSEFDQSLATASELFPEAFEEGSDFYNAVDARRTAIEKRNPNFFNQADWPELLVAAEAAKLGIAPISKQSAKAAGVTPVARTGVAAKVQPKKAATRLNPASSASSDGLNGTITQPETEADVEKMIASANTEEELDSIMKMFGTPAFPTTRSR